MVIEEECRREKKNEDDEEEGDEEGEEEGEEEMGWEGEERERRWKVEGQEGRRRRRRGKREGGEQEEWIEGRRKKEEGGGRKAEGDAPSSCEGPEVGVQRGADTNAGGWNGIEDECQGESAGEIEEDPSHLLRHSRYR